ncbi:hypothetical protein ACFQNE_02090 [Gordonia phosphorivorans]|uniref:Gp28/Gp37-like domain-containing protein n=1 Tax=Gordonia phosphorivorans TaxID=1056982 RepID=A0ABV6H6G9_9ACTN
MASAVVTAEQEIRLDGVRTRVMDRRRIEAVALAAKPEVIICDKQWQKVCYLQNELLADAEEIANDTGEADITIPGRHRLAAWLLSKQNQPADVHMIIETPYKRWAGKCQSIQRVVAGGEMVAIKLHFLHDYDRAKKMYLFAVPASPAEVQPLKAMPWVGPSVTGVNTYALTNAWRNQSPLNMLPGDILDPGNWSNYLPENWWTTWVPNNPLTDGSRWTAMSARFPALHDHVLPTLLDGGLHMSVQRWMPGDPPIPGVRLSGEHAVRVFKTVDKSGYVGYTGTIADGILNTVGVMAEDFINEVRTELAREVPEEYKLPGIFGTHKSAPAIVIPEGEYTPLSSSTMTLHKAIAYAMITGGKSPQWVNSLAKLAANAALGWLGATIGNPGLALGVFDFLVEDTILAFHRLPNFVRADMMGPDADWEMWVQGPGVGATLSTLQAMRVGLWDSRFYTSYQAEVEPAAMGWKLGKHYDLMDRLTFEIGGGLYVDNLTRWGVSWSATEPVRYRLTIGDGRAEEAPAAKATRYKESLLAVIQQQGVLSDGGTM